MNNIVFNKRQSTDIAKAIYNGIRSHCDSNLERFLYFYFEERKKSNGLPLEPLRIKFYPYAYLSNCTEGTENKDCEGVHYEE